jgi:glycosyltransferase involved in cell wall biosynthesis
MSQPNSVLVYATQYMLTGGIESHLQEFCRNLSKSGVQIDLVVLNSKMPAETEIFFRRICRLPWLIAISLKLRFITYAALYTNGQGDSLQLVSRLLPHYTCWVHHHHTSGDTADQATWSLGYQQALRTADVVIACSQRNASDMQAALARPVQSLPCFSRAIKFIEHQLSEQLHFGYYGRLIPEKGIDVLCKLSQDAALKGIELHLWGEGEAYSSDFFAQYPKIHYHGAFTGYEELQAVIHSLDAYLLLSTNPEGLPIALLEVMSAGLPWIATARGGVPDIACDPQATRLLPTTATYDEMKTAIVRLAADIRRGQVSRNAQQTLYTERFSAPVLIKHWRSILKLG